MDTLEILKDFYLTQRYSMEKDLNFLIGSITISLILFFYSRKSSFFSLFPLVCLVLRYAELFYTDSVIIKYLVSSPIRFMISSYILTYMLIYLTTLVLMICTGLFILNLSDEYSQYLDVSIYNWILVILIGILFFYVKKLQGVMSVITASIYSSLFLLNGVEILTKKEIGMVDLHVPALILTVGMALTSLIIQRKIHKKK